MNEIVPVEEAPVAREPYEALIMRLSRQSVLKRFEAQKRARKTGAETGEAPAPGDEAPAAKRCARPRRFSSASTMPVPSGSRSSMSDEPARKTMRVALNEESRFRATSSAPRRLRHLCAACAAS